MERENWLKDLVRLYGNNFKWPPYPNKFDPSVIPKFIKHAWQRERFYFDKEKKIYTDVKKLLVDREIKIPAVGDSFNAIVIQRRKATEYKGLYRILQFDTKGYVHYENSASRQPTLKEGEVRAGLIYRFKVTAIEEDHFNCVALAHTFNKNNLIENWIYCNYKESRRN